MIPQAVLRQAEPQPKVDTLVRATGVGPLGRDAPQPGEALRPVAQSDPHLGPEVKTGALDEDAVAADLIEQYEARIVALERLVGKQALELEFVKGALKSAPRQKSAPTSVIVGPPAYPSLKIPGLVGNRPFDLLRRRACADRRHRNRSERPPYVCSWVTGSPRDGRPNRSPVG